MGKCKRSVIMAVIGWSISIVGIVVVIWLDNKNENLQKELIRLAEPNPIVEKVEIIANSTEISNEYKYETQALVKIENIGLKGEKDFIFAIEVNRSAKIVRFECDDYLVIPVKEGSESYRKIYKATLRGERSIEGILFFRSDAHYEREETAVPIKVIPG